MGGTVLFNGFTRTEGGQVAVIRNAGPLDNRQFRAVVPPGSSLTWTGLFSQRHPYPGSQRFYTISGRPSEGRLRRCRRGDGADQRRGRVAAVVKGGGTANNTNIARIQETINKSLKEDFESALGGPYITNVVFRVSKVALPVKLQQAVTDAQASFAQITQAQAKVASATAEAAAISQRQKGYENCPACAQIDLLKAIPPSVTTFAPGTGFAVTTPAR